MEVGGRLVVDSASFTVMPRDKVGIVGRNGAGKTSLFKVLGGATEPKSGKVLRKGGFGYLPQDPKIDTALDGRSCVSHILSGKGIDDEIEEVSCRWCGNASAVVVLAGRGAEGGDVATGPGGPPAEVGGTGEEGGASGPTHPGTGS